MAGAWDTPPTPEELKAAGWDKPPTAQELADYQEIEKQNIAAERGEEAERRRALFERASQNDTAPLLIRAQVGMKKTKAGKANFLRAKGYEPFEHKGELGYVDEKGEPHLIEKPNKVELADVLDVGSQIVEAAPGVIAGLVGGRLKSLTPLRASAKLGAVQSVADLAGSAAAQGISAMLPGSDEMTVVDRAKSAGINVAAGALPTAAAAAGRGAYRAVGPKPVFQRRIEGQVMGGGSQEAVAKSVQEGLALEQRIGGPPLSATELAQTQSGHGLFNALRRNQKSADVVREADIAHAQALEEHAHKTVAALVGGRTVSSDQAGRMAGVVWNKAVQQKRNMMSAALDDAFARAEQAGGAVQLPNTMAVQKEIAARFGTPFSTATGEAITEGATRRFSKLNKMAEGGAAPALTIREVQNSLSQWGKAAQGSEMALENIDNKAVQRKLAVMVKNALLKDLDAAIAKAPGAEALIEARDLTRAMYDDLSYMDSTLLKTAFKLEQRGSAGKVSRMIARGTFTKEEVAKATAILRQASPDTANDLAAGTFQAMLSKTVKSGQMNPAAFNRIFSAPENREILAGVLGSTKEAKAFLASLADEVKYAERISRGGTAAGMSPTSPLQQIEKIIGGVPLVQGAVNVAAEHMVKLRNPRTLAVALTSVEGRKTFLGLVKSANRGRTQDVVRGVVQLGELIARDEILYGDTDLPRKEDQE